MIRLSQPDAIIIALKSQYFNPEMEVDREQLYDRIRRKDKSITTSAPSPGDYLKAYQELSQEAESILCITFAPSMDMAYRAAISGYIARTFEAS